MREITTVNINNEALELVNFLFKIFEVHIKSFDFLFASDQSKLDFCKKEWVVSFRNAKLEKQDVIRGANKIRAMPVIKYMIAPIEFIELCNQTPTDIGAPSIENAFKESAEHSNPATWKSTWSHCAVKEAYKRTGNYQFLNGTYEKTFQIFSQHYLNCCNDFSAGRILDQIPYKKPFSSSDINRPFVIGKYDMTRPGIMKIYENLKSSEECFSICEKLCGKGESRLKALIGNLESKYNNEGLI